jgi:uncharacterized protein
MCLPKTAQLKCPILPHSGMPHSTRGAKQSPFFLQFVRDLYSDFGFENVQVLIDTPEQVFAEYEFTVLSSKS